MTTEATTTTREPATWLGGHQCPYCQNWFMSTAFVAHLDEEFDARKAAATESLVS